jgi:hypothetical protein
MMSERNFLRHFSAEIGLSPSDYLLKVRLDMSCRLLVETDLPVDKIARRCGISNGGQLSKLFRTYLADADHVPRQRATTVRSLLQAHSQLIASTRSSATVRPTRFEVQVETDLIQYHFNQHRTVAHHVAHQ